MADCLRPLLGADFIRRHQLLVDLIANDRLIDTTTFKTYKCRSLPSQRDAMVLLPISSDLFLHLLRQFLEITEPTFRESCPSHDVYHRISTQGLPVSSRTRRLCPQKLKIAKDEFYTMRPRDTRGHILTHGSSSVPRDKVHGAHAETTGGSIWYQFLTGILFPIYMILIANCTE